MHPTKQGKIKFNTDMKKVGAGEMRFRRQKRRGKPTHRKKVTGACKYANSGPQIGFKPSNRQCKEENKIGYKI